MQGKELGDEDPRLMPAANVVRWRWGIDEQGNRVQESNARIVKWSDGTTQLLIGAKVALDAVPRPITEHHAVFAKLGAGVIEEQTVVTESLHLRPTGLTRRAFNKHKNSVISSKEAAKKIRKVVIKPAVDEKVSPTYLTLTSPHLTSPSPSLTLTLTLTQSCHRSMISCGRRRSS